ncbi:unannotated protein [freshwater metagenome]|uniref:Unannotated protein n=1 Tax=freshwater metagenome TaxID=449393 RepID=A0A6J7E0F0_9ZZZZ
MLRDDPQRVEAVSPALADTHEDSRGERDRQSTGGLKCRKASLRTLVRSTPMALQFAIQRFEHHALACRAGPQDREFVVVQRPRVRVGQQPGCLEHQLAHRCEVVHRRRITTLGQPRCRCRIAVLRSLAEREQRLVTTASRSCAGDLEHLFGFEEQRTGLGRRLRKCAVPAGVVTERGERDEHLGRVRHPGAVLGSLDRASRRQEVGERGVEETLVVHASTLT